MAAFEMNVLYFLKYFISLLQINNMKKKFLLFAALSLVFFSCNSESSEDSSPGEGDSSEKKEAINLSKFEEVAVEPCNLLTQEMITNEFDVTADELEEENYVGKNDKISSYDICKYSWKKPNYEEINKRNQIKIMESMTQSMKTGETKGTVKMAMSMEEPNFFVGVTNLDTYETEEKAKKRFELLHQVPGKEDIEKLNQEINKQDTLTEDNKEMGKDIAGGIVANMKFEQVNGIGTEAYWDFMDNQLDILYGAVQIGIVIHISEDHDENVKAAKKIANKVMTQF